MSTEPALAHEAKGAVPGEHHHRPEKILLRPYPKIVFLYPTWFAAILFGLCGSLLGKEFTEDWRLGFWFLVITGLNLVVLSFDFPRTTSLTLLAIVIAFVFGALWLNHTFHVIEFLRDFVLKIQPFADAQFYWTFAAIMLVIYIFVFIDTRFDYWEVMPNEIIHYSGILGNVKRFPAPQLKLEKDITDVFEFLLLRSGRLLMHPSSERITIVLENVPNINRREEDIQRLLRVLDVHVHKDADTGEDT